jgi:phosphopantothenoylcysteine decarboxylase/phosphopantothenate--cysteine ligase
MEIIFIKRRKKQVDMLKDKKILLGVTGGISAYKAIELASLLTKAGAVVRTILTQHAQEFVGAINFAAITGMEVLTKEFQLSEPIAHVNWAGWADLIVIAPATADMVAKAANGIADDLLSSTIIASPRPIFFVPAMNVFMYANKANQRNLNTLREDGHYIMEPASGILACGYEGKGRLPEPREVMDAIITFANYTQDLKGKKVLVSAGASREGIDPMRFITNHSTGKMGLALAKAAYWRGAEVTFIHGWMSEEPPYYLNSIHTPTAEAMHREIMKIVAEQDIVLMTAAVADYTVAEPADTKIKKTGDLTLQLVRTKDILAEIGRDKLIGQKLVGFAAESEKVIENARLKLEKKNLDCIVANNISVSGSDSTEMTILNRHHEQKFCGSKSESAHLILDFITERNL